MTKKELIDVDFNVAKRLETIRTTQGLSKSRLARLANISQPYLSEVEKGIKTPTLDVLQKLCKALGITLVEFFSDGCINLPCQLEGPSEYKRICHAARMLDSQELKIVQQLVDKILENRLRLKNPTIITSELLEEYIKLLENK